ncbi:ribonuclease domain-containing protein [Actinomadura kijaniata]|uniref:Ribonuclease T1 n=1 Tax=Actinomadura namibiensis TaxID=182080 RepID=A0A7W3LLT8_ACTNM|nr:ribonuclease domain-containing protein [Actinomadura namibiensis]MBA8950521.1 ribonuclease T1 [Actinomadura namibiensis]
MAMARRAAGALAACVLAPLLTLGLGACAGQRSGTTGPVVPASPSAGGSAPRTGRTAAPSEITVAELPPEARETLRLIEAGGPFPHRRDGTYFLNREGLLPARERGHYREYTVPTPGERTRGARRIVAGRDGERYYTADHYRSFSRVVGERSGGRNRPEPTGGRHDDH